MNAMLSRMQAQPCTIGTRTCHRAVVRPYKPLKMPLVVRRWSSERAVVARAAVPDRPTGAEAAILKLTDSLRLLETERDEAVGTAESAARSAVKLEEMTRLLERLAMDKVAEGDDAGARRVLQEKVAVAEVLTRTSSRAQTNFALAAKLAEKIGQHQADLMEMLGGSSSSSSAGGGGGSSNPSRTPATRSTPSPAPVKHAPPQPRPSYPASSSSSSSSTGSGSGTGSSYSSSGRGSGTGSSSYSSSGTGSGTGSSSYSSSGIGSNAGSNYSSSSAYEAPWEKSLAQARERVQQAEAEAAAAGSAAARKGRESLEDARERLRRQALSSVASARSRIQSSASESIEAARARIAAEDAAALAQVHAFIDRYKAGQYVSEDDLDWAFRQLEQRAWRS